MSPSEIIEEETNDFALSMSDHHFYNFNFSPTAPKFVHSTIMEEWNALCENLPPTIFVRIDPQRFDLMSVAIIGAAGTPYHDGLYFFDIAFPDNYPFQPPFVHYRSYGLSINPNLSSNGDVCISLLRENWIPFKSSMRQVLVSLQALVSNEKPYYNEPEHLAKRGEKYSDLYNEDVFINSCVTMLRTLRKPPRNFESFVEKHFHERGRVILEACVAYVTNTVKVGYYGGDGSFRGEVSSKFKRMMMELVPKMADAFAWNGGRRPELLSFVEQMKTKTNDGFFGMIKKVLGWD